MPSKQELIERYNQINVEHDWWVDTVKEFCETLRDDHSIDVDPKDVYFSGFSSQGDGASFTGTIDCIMLLVDMSQYPLLSKWKAESPGATLQAKINRYAGHRYMHSGTMTVELDAWLPPTGEEIVQEIATNDLTQAVAEVENWAAKVEEEITAATNDAQTKVRELADKLYQTLSEEYDYRTSDEQVWDAVVANGLNQGVDDEETDDGAADDGAAAGLQHDSA